MSNTYQQNQQRSQDRVYVECTSTYHTGLNTGIQRVVRKLVEHSQPAGDQVGLHSVPVIYDHGHFVPIGGLADLRVRALPRLRVRLNMLYSRWTNGIAARLASPKAKKFLTSTRRSFGLAWIIYQPVRFAIWLKGLLPRNSDPSAGIEAHWGQNDILLIADAGWSNDIADALPSLKARGVMIAVVIYDVIPLTHPWAFETALVDRFTVWIRQVLQEADVLVCISGATLNALREWASSQGIENIPQGYWFHLGHDFGHEQHAPANHQALRAVLDSRTPSFLCVGTLEPRKNHGFLLDAFELVWRQGSDCQLILIGRKGWMSESLVDRILRHEAYGRLLFWFDDVTDADLEVAYRKSEALIFASVAEGFGLPIVEALSKGLHVIASDIPVFREVGGSHLHYFDLAQSGSLAAAIESRLASRSPRSQQAQFDWPSWQDSVLQLLSVVREAHESRQGSNALPPQPG